MPFKKVKTTKKASKLKTKYSSATVDHWLACDFIKTGSLWVCIMFAHIIIIIIIIIINLFQISGNMPLLTHLFPMLPFSNP